MGYKEKIRRILKEGGIPEEKREKLLEITLSDEELESRRIMQFLHHTFTTQYLCSDKLGKWHGEPVTNILAWLEKQSKKDKLINEITESEDEKIRNEIIQVFKGQIPFTTEEDAKKYIDWLEKQGTLANYDEAEREKYDYVSGQFLECRKSFDVFKEDNSYCFEYIGDDIYIGRSDNILNQKFHITPRQLFKLFTVQHCPKETNAPTGNGKYIDDCLNEAAKHFFSKEENKYSVADLFYAGVRCGVNVAEKQKQEGDKDIRQKYLEELLIADDIYQMSMNTNMVAGAKEKAINAISKMCIGELLGFVEKQGEKVNEIKPIFNVGNWITNGEEIGQVIKWNHPNCIGYKTNYGTEAAFNKAYISKWHLWTIQDAKDGDVLVSQYNKPFIYNGNYNEYNVGAYCGILCDGSMFIEANCVCQWAANKKITPATKEQRDLLFAKMKEEGYKWNAKEKRVLQLQSKQEWNEKDEKMLNSIIEDTALPYVVNLPQYSTEEKIKLYESSKAKENWLRSLKEKIIWKPTEEQMKCLLSEVTAWKKGCSKQIILESLYNDLRLLCETRSSK